MLFQEVTSLNSANFDHHPVEDPNTGLSCLRRHRRPQFRPRRCQYKFLGIETSRRATLLKNGVDVN